MTRHPIRTVTVALALAVGLAGCSTSTMAPLAAQSLMGQMGGMSSMTSLSNTFLRSSARDPLLGSMTAGTDISSVSPTLSNQLCSVLGGGCAAPLGSAQVADGAKELTPAQASAVNSNFASSLGGMGLSSTLKDAVTKAVSPSLPGIFGALF